MIYVADICEVGGVCDDDDDDDDEGAHLCYHWRGQEESQAGAHVTHLPRLESH